MKKFLSGAVLALTSIHVFGAPAASLTIGDNAVDPLGYHDPTPVFSWKLPVGVKKQTAYRLEVTTDGKTQDTGWISSDRSVFVPYSGEPFVSRQRGEWRVNFRDENGDEGGWSERARFEMSLLSNEDWKAQWIQPSQPDPKTGEAVATVRRAFPISKSIASARLYVTARGLFEVHLNDQRIGDDYFANGWTSYHKRLDTLTYDVTGQLTSGSNRLRVDLGKGWYAGRMAWGKNRNGQYGKNAELLLQLEISYTDGSKEQILSDGSWEGTFSGPIVSSSIYDGEIYDARRNPVDWAPVKANPGLGSARLTPKPFAPVRETETLPTIGITEPEPGRFVFDLGQNIAGWPRLRIPVEKDGTITVRFAELLNQDGTLYTANYRSAKSTNTYTAAENGTIDWRPRFTFHGFRYVELSGLPKGVTPRKEWVTGLALHSDMKPIGKFTSSSKLLNRLQNNIVWGQRCNFLDIPTDCPQRDERLGWTGDAQVFCATAMFNYDCLAFWKSWLGSMRDDQSADGAVANIVPAVVPGDGNSGWMDAGTIIPWEVYIRTGDTEILAENYGMMEKLVGWYRSKAPDGLMPEDTKGVGDWLQPYAKTIKGETPFPLLATAFYARSAEILANTASVLGKEEDAKRYTEESNRVKAAFSSHYFDENGKLRNAPETQTAYVLALEFGLVSETMNSLLTGHLARLIEAADGHLRTGFLGTPYIVPVLDRNRQQELSYDLLFKETYPSWFYSIHQGATTMWERWNSYSHDKGFGDAKMNSFNHYAYGAIGQWMYERVAGLAPDPSQPGYKHFFIRPLTGKHLDFAEAQLDTPYGITRSAWKKENGKLVLDAIVPPNTTATIELPGNHPPQTVPAGEHRFEVDVPK
ncbi:MAG: family 78 glycoside hydrolase catalytic domain [Luteolibacter sp.]